MAITSDHTHPARVSGGQGSGRDEEIGLEEVLDWNLRSEHSGALARLLSHLRRRGRFTLIVAEFNDAVYRDRVIDWAEKLAHCKSARIQAPEKEDDFADFERQIADEAAEHDAVHLLGISETGGNADFIFRGFNLHREAIVESCSAPMILWLRPHEVKKFATEAPDMWAWRDLVLDFTVSLERLPERLDFEWEIDGSSATQLRKRVKEIEHAFESRSLSPTMRLRLGNYLGDLYNELGDSKHAIEVWNSTRSEAEFAGDSRLAAMLSAKVATARILNGRYQSEIENLKMAANRFHEMGDSRSEAVTWGRVADALTLLGKPHDALDIIQTKELPVFEKLGDARAAAICRGQMADVIGTTGDLDGAIRLFEHEVLPVFKKLSEPRLEAVALSKVASLYEEQGRFNEALKIRREKVLPAFEEFGSDRDRAVAWSNLADSFQERGEWEESVKLRERHALPVFKELGDELQEALTWERIADARRDQGNLNEAMQIYEDRVLPVCEKVGNNREIAIVWSKIADIFQLQGKWNDAIGLYQDKALRMFQQLGELREIILARFKLGLTLAKRGNRDDADDAVEHIWWAYRTAQSHGYHSDAEKIENVLNKLGLEVNSEVAEQFSPQTLR